MIDEILKYNQEFVKEKKYEDAKENFLVVKLFYGYKTY